MEKMSDQDPEKNETNSDPRQEPQPPERPVWESEAPEGAVLQPPGQDERTATGPVAGAVGPSGDAAVIVTRREYEELNTLARERDDYLKRLQRAVADYQNLQKRVEKDRTRLYQKTVEEAVQHMLPVADNLSRALEAAQNTEGAEDILEGLKLLEKEFYSALEKFGVKPIEAVGTEFDPHYHEAVMSEQHENTPPTTVVRELKKGFAMGDRVIRHAQVTVSVRRPAEQAEDADRGSEGPYPEGEAS